MKYKWLKRAMVYPRTVSLLLWIENGFQFFEMSKTALVSWKWFSIFERESRENYLLQCNYWRTENYWTPSTSGWARSESGLLLMIMAALPLIRVMDILWNNCLMAMFSSIPWWRDNAAPILFVCSTATLWKPPRVSRAKGRKEIPCSWQAWAAPSTLLEGLLKCASSSSSSWCHVWLSERSSYRNINGAIFAINPPPYQKVSWASNGARQEMGSFSDRSKSNFLESPKTERFANARILMDYCIYKNFLSWRWRIDDTVHAMLKVDQGE